MMYDDDDSSDSSIDSPLIAHYREILDLICDQLTYHEEMHGRSHSSPGEGEDSCVAVLLCQKCRSPITTTRNILHERNFSACSRYVYSYELDLFDNDEPIWVYSATNPSSTRFDVLRVNTYITFPRTFEEKIYTEVDQQVSESKTSKEQNDTNSSNTKADSNSIEGDGVAHVRGIRTENEPAIATAPTATTATTTGHMESSEPKSPAQPAPVEASRESNSAQPCSYLDTPTEESTMSERDWEHRPVKLRVVHLGHTYYQEHSFFEGYAWCMCYCMKCSNMLGWGFAPQSEAETHGVLGTMHTETSELDETANLAEGEEEVPAEEEVNQQDEGSSEHEASWQNNHSPQQQLQQEEEDTYVPGEEHETRESAEKDDQSGSTHKSQLMPHFIGLIVTRCVGVPLYPMRVLQRELRSQARLIALAGAQIMASQNRSTQYSAIAFRLNMMRIANRLVLASSLRDRSDEEDDNGGNNDPATDTRQVDE